MAVCGLAAGSVEAGSNQVFARNVGTGNFSKNRICDSIAGVFLQCSSGLLPPDGEWYSCMSHTWGSNGRWVVTIDGGGVNCRRKMRSRSACVFT